MGKKEQENLTAAADLLADIIVFLIKHRSVIQVAYNRIQKTKSDYDEKTNSEWGYDYYSLAEIREGFKRFKKRKLDSIETVIEAYPLLVSADHLIETCLRDFIMVARRRVGHKYHLQFENGINSETSQKSTNLMILPRWITMWEGSGEDREVDSDSFNRFLKHARYLNKNGSYAERNYKVNCYFLEKIKAAYLDLSQGRNQLSIGMCPMACDFHLRDNNKENNDLFLPRPWGKTDKARIKNIVISAIEKAEARCVNMLVFPEMLGYVGLKDEICHYLREVKHDYLKLIVLPSVWEIINTNGTNTSYLIQTSDGTEVLSQGKLVAYSDRSKMKTEALIPTDTLNLLYDEVHGCVGILICRGALETKVRNVIVDDMGVKLMIVPSWSREEHAFERILMSESDMNCNIVWVNSCSALECKNDEELKQKPVCMMSQVCKVKGKDKLTPKVFHPIKDCEKECINGEACLFVWHIEGVVKDE